MSVFRVVMAGAAALVMAVAAVPHAWAFLAQEGGASSSETYQTSQQTTNLSPLIVYGNHLPLPIALQMVKKALTRAFSRNPADADKMVCQFEAMTGTHFQTLDCETNREHFKRQDKTQLDMLNGRLDMRVVDWMNQHWINRGALMTLLKKLPPADSSYTLQVTDHGKPIIEYVIKDGELVAVHKLADKDQKQH